MNELAWAWILAGVGFALWGPLLYALGSIMGTMKEADRIRGVLEDYHIVPRDAEDPAYELPEIFKD